MGQPEHKIASAEGNSLRRFCVFNMGFHRDPHIKRILELKNLSPKFGWPSRSSDIVGVWGNSPRAWRGETVSKATGTPIVRIEDAFLRSVLPGRAGDGPFGITLNYQACAYDSAQVSDLEHILSTDPLNAPELIAEAERGIQKIQQYHLTKYAGVDPEVIVQRLAEKNQKRPTRVNRALSKIQGLFAGFAPLWR